MTEQRKGAVKQRHAPLVTLDADVKELARDLLPLMSGAQHNFFQQLKSWGMLKEEDARFTI